MKKVLSVILALALVFVLVSCSSGENESTVADETEAKNTGPVLTLSAESTDVTPGQTVEVILHVKDAPFTACFDIFIYSDEKLVYESDSKAKGLDSSLILAANYMEDNSPSYVALRGIVASTADILDNDLYIIEYTVSEEAVSGDKLSVTVQVPMYQVGTDETGNEVYSVTEYIEINNLILNVV